MMVKFDKTIDVKEEAEFLITVASMISVMSSEGVSPTLGGQNNWLISVYAWITTEQGKKVRILGVHERQPRVSIPTMAYGTPMDVFLSKDFPMTPVF